MSDEATGLSIRNLQEGFAGTPLRRFYAVLDSLPTEPATGYEGTRVNLNFRELEPLESIEPVNLPTVTLNMGLSNKKKSRWGYLGTSMLELIPETEDVEDQCGKRMGLVYCDGQDGRPEPKPIWSKDSDREVYPNGEVPTAVWTVFELDGAVAGGAGVKGSTDRAMELLDGKTLSEFNKLAYADTAIRKDTELQRSITDKSFVKGLVAAGKFTKDENDIYHLAAVAEA